MLLAGTPTSCFKDYIYVIGLNTTLVEIKKNLLFFSFSCQFLTYRKNKTLLSATGKFKDIVLIVQVHVPEKSVHKQEV